MRRWNGWGDDTVTYPLHEAAYTFIRDRIGKATPPADATFADVIKNMPPSRLPDHPMVKSDPVERLLHARGQSLPDWVALRSGHIGVFPDGVAYPLHGDDLTALLRYAITNGIRLIPYGGGTSVVGHINPLSSAAPVLSVDMRRMNRLLKLEANTLLATFGAGVTGPDLEAQLRAQGYTLGHYPQSFEYSTLGGWIAARSSGQQSYHYGRIENLFAGGKVITPAGMLEIPPFPASAAGTDLREMVLGSEGRLGFISEATIRISPLAERDEFHAIFFPDFTDAIAAVRTLAQARLPLSMLRLSSPVESETTLKLAGHERAQQVIEGLLAMRGISGKKAMLMLGVTGHKALGKTAFREALHLAGKFGGVHLPIVAKIFGNQWRKSRFRTPYLRNTLWEAGYAVDTLETALPWTHTHTMIDAIENALRRSMETYNEPIHVFTHLSHVYPYGSSVYTTYLFRLAPDPEETLQRWRSMKEAASLAVGVNGGTISHQHGVGLDHRAYLEAEKGERGIQALRSLFRHFDPHGLMNPGKLVE